MYLRVMSIPNIPQAMQRAPTRITLVSGPTETAPCDTATPPPRSGKRAQARAAADASIGTRLRMRRTLLGIGQEQLAAELGISYQQVHNYECGANRISASMLWELSRLLDVHVSYFFDDIPPEPQPGAIAIPPSDKATMRRQTLELVRAFYAVPESARTQLFDFVKSMARTFAPR